jgi:hypothetical protein
VESSGKLQGKHAQQGDNSKKTFPFVVIALDRSIDEDNIIAAVVCDLGASDEFE